MSDNRLQNEILESKNLNFEIFSSPIGKILILGSEKHIKTILFINNEQQINEISSKIKKNLTTEMLKIFNYLQDYFDNGVYISGPPTAAREECFQGASPLKPHYNKMRPDNELTNLKKYKISILSDRITKTTMNSDTIQLDLSSYTNTEIKVYKNLQKINPGKTISYKELGEKSGLKKAARFIGNTMAKNNFPIIIPCHRVIKSNGDMGHFSGGVHIKKYLLELEK